MNRNVLLLFACQALMNAIMSGQTVMASWFAAAEVADTHAKAKAISLVLAGGVVAAIVGPEMVKRTNALIPAYVFLATYLYLPVPVITAILLHFVKVPPAEKKIGISLRFRTISRTDFVTAVLSSLVATER